MDLNVENVFVKYDAGQRYSSPEVTRFWASDGPYSMFHLYDIMLQRDVLFCEEHLWMVEQDRKRYAARVGRNSQGRCRFVKEARIGTLGHPNILPTFDFGVSAKSGLMFFTRPLPPWSLFTHFNSPFERASTLEFYDYLLSRGEHWISQELLESGRKGAAATLERALKQQLILEWRRSETMPHRTLLLPDEQVKARVSAHLQQELVRAERDAESSGWTEQALERRIRTVQFNAIDELVFEMCKLNDLNRRKLAYHEGLIVPNLRRFIDLLRIACGAIAFAHQRGIWHLALSEYEIACGDEEGEVYVTRWLEARVPGDEDFAQFGLPHSTRYGSIAESMPGPYTEEIPVSASVDIVGLGRVLSFLLHEELTGEGQRQDGVRSHEFRSVYSPSNENARADLTALITRLDAVRRKAMQYDPDNRYASASEFAAALSSSLSVRTFAAPPSLSELIADEPPQDDPPDPIDLSLL